ncbi:MAG: 50S ribosomal protein L15 [Elusimicrobia bacterium CG08_land_8_20_14_0_20_44_26]|nr:MAG: 50S ribosomal protein L15 [Elusimicrobia bacterium CG08_land_8_20_14_0_20_44_26]
MSFVELKAFANSSKQKKRRRGHVHGRYCGKGLKGEKARAGRKHVAVLEGGQMPLVRRLPKRGFSNKKFENKFEVVNLTDIEKKFKSADKVTRETLMGKGLVKGKKPVKILGAGSITKEIFAEIDAISVSAAEKIKKAKGTVIIKEDKKNINSTINMGSSELKREEVKEIPPPEAEKSGSAK